MSDIETGALLRRTLALLAQSGGRLLLALAALTAVAVFADVGIDPRNRTPVDLLTAGVTLFLQTWLTIKLLEAHDERRGNRGVASVFGIGILAGLGIAIGFLLLVVPGIILLVRWSASVPYALAEDIGVTDALRRSFDETREAFWPILFALLACYAPLALAVATGLLMESEGITIASSLVVNLLINLGLLAGWHAAVAIYLLGRRETRLGELFA